MYTYIYVYGNTWEHLYVMGKKVSERDRGDVATILHVNMHI